MPHGKKVRLFCSDLDGTLLGEPEASDEFRRVWEGLGEDRPVLVYSTGRLLEDAMRVVAEGGLPTPDYFIGGVGTMLLHVESGRGVDGFSELLDEGWNLDRVREVVRQVEGIKPQPDVQQNPWKSSWFWHAAEPGEVDALRKALSDAGVDGQVVYSSKRDLDVLPRKANKGNALIWLCGKLGIGTDEAVVAGDTGNDESMFLVPGVRGIAVGNAEAELIDAIGDTPAHRATGFCAAGVLEGLRAHGVTA